MVFSLAIIQNSYASSIKAPKKSATESLLTKICLKGRFASCTELAEHFELGQNRIRQNFDKAKYFYEYACNAKYIPACRNLARLLKQGNTEHTQNKPRALKIYESSCLLGDAKSCHQLGLDLFYGKTKAVNRKLANYYFGIACQALNGEACYFLAKQLETGDGIAQDKFSALEAYKRGCNTGNLKSCVKICLQGYDIGCKNYDLLNGNISQ